MTDTPPTTAAGAPAAPNATTKGLETVTHPTAMAALTAVFGVVGTLLAQNPKLSGWPDYVSFALAVAAGTWAVLGPKASAKA